MNIYLLSGLGADHRVFSKLSFPKEYKINNIEWISPLKKEALSDYAKRLMSQIDYSNPFILIGVSFGGIIAVELCKLIKPEQVILISSVWNSKQIPWYYTFLGKLKLHQFIPSSILKSANFLTYWFFGAENKDQKNLLKKILVDTDSKFLKWAISKIITWNNNMNPENLLHLHGLKDKILPISCIKADYEIKNGGHLMVYVQHKEVSEILFNKLKGH